MVASRYGHVEVVDKLLQHGATVDLQKVVHYNTPQMLVSHNREPRKPLNIFNVLPNVHGRIILFNSVAQSEMFMIYSEFLGVFL